MSQRYFIAQTPQVGAEISIAGAEAHHMSHVMRLAAGDKIVLFDGTGAEYSARLTRGAKRQVWVEILDRTYIDREAAKRLELAVALPRGDRQTWLVEKAVELGVHSIVPLITERSVAIPTQKTLNRLSRTVVESSKQCGRNRLLRIAAPCRLADYLITVAEAASARWLAHPHEPSGCAPQLPSEQSNYRIAVGPEGGFTPAEVDFARQSGWQIVSCGPRILRVETAAIAISARVLL